MADLGNPKSHPGEPAHSKGQNTAFQNSGVYLATRTIPHSEIRNSPPRVPLRPPREATGEDARLQCAPTVSQRRPTRRHADTPFPYLSAGTAIENTLPGPVNSANRRVRTVAALNSPRANPIQMPIAPAPRMNAKRYAAGMATPQ
jgi:hypothetical protein